MNKENIINNSNNRKPRDRFQNTQNNENKGPQTASSSKITQGTSASRTSISKKPQVVWVEKGNNGSNKMVQNAGQVSPKPLVERNLNVPREQHQDDESTKKLPSKPREVVQIEKPELKVIKTETKAVNNYVNFFKVSNTDKYKEDLDYFNSLEQHPKIKNIRRDRRTKREYTYIEGNNLETYKQQIALGKVYSELGVFVPEHKLLNTGEGEYIFLIQEVVGKKPSEYLKTASEEQKMHFYGEVCKVFAADVLFNNTKVLAGDLDSAYLVSPKGSICRSSVSMLTISGEGLAYPVEIWEARDKTKNTTGHIIWSTLNILEIANQIIKVIRTSDTFFYGLSDKHRAIADRRLTNLLILANKTLSMSEDGWNTGYIESINKHIVGLKKAGCERALPVWLYSDVEKGDEPCRLRGPKGILFEGLRGKNSVVEKVLMPYVGNNNGNYQFIIDWMIGHESSGWSTMSQILMHFLTFHRKAPNSGYYWKEGEAKAESYYNERAILEGKGNLVEGAKIIENSFITLHAFTQIVLGGIDFPNNNLCKNGEGNVRFLRTESRHVIFNYSRVFADDIDMQMGVYSSGSVVTDPPLVHGTEITERFIPHHRVIALYFMLRTLAEKNRGAFSNDFQNEFTGILGGINCNYISSLKV